MSKGGKLQPAIKEMCRLFKKYDMDYEQTSYVTSEARLRSNILRDYKRRKLPKLLTDLELEGFFKAVERGGDGFHLLMLKLMYSSALRVSELVNLKISDMDTEKRRIFIENSKNGVDRYVDFDESVKGALHLYLISSTRKKQKYLFESGFNRHYSTRAIGKMIKRYGVASGLERAQVYPHLFRHMQATKRLNNGMQLKKLSLFLGHANISSTEIYLHLTTNDYLESS